MTRVEPRTGSVVATIPVGPGPSALAVGEGGVWVVNRHVGTLWRIDPATNAPTEVVHIGSDPAAVAVGKGAVWVAGGEEGVVTRVDPAHPGEVEKVKTGNSPAAIAVAGGSVWAAAGAPLAAHRGGTLRVRLPYQAGLGIPMDWLHWQAYTTWETAQLSSLAYDGLVAYRRVDGAAGTTLVGALATSVPTPSRAAAATSSRCGPGCATPTAGPSCPRTSGRRWSAFCKRRAPTGSRPSMRPLSAPGAAPPGTPAATLRAGSKQTCRRARSRSISRARTGTSCKSSPWPSPSSCPPTAPGAPRRGGRRRAPAPTASSHGTGTAAAHSSATGTSDRLPLARAVRASRTASRSARTS